MWRIVMLLPALAAFLLMGWGEAQVLGQPCSTGPGASVRVYGLPDGSIQPWQPWMADFVAAELRIECPQCNPQCGSSWDWNGMHLGFLFEPPDGFRRVFCPNEHPPDDLFCRGVEHVAWFPSYPDWTGQWDPLGWGTVYGLTYVPKSSLWLTHSLQTHLVIPLAIDEPESYPATYSIDWYEYGTAIHEPGDVWWSEDTLPDHLTPWSVTFVEAGDLNADGQVGLADLRSLLRNYGMAAGANYADGDVDQDGDVDLGDILTLLEFYGQQ